MPCWSCGCENASAVVACGSCGALLRLGESYRVVKLRGQGGAGIVYEAVDETLDRTVAIKVMHGQVAQNPGKRTRFLSECKAMAALKHDGIAEIYASGQQGDQLYFVQRFIRGAALNEQLEAHPEGVELHDALLLAHQLLSALAHAHKHGIVHRDINPNNVLMEETDEGPVAVLIDFGMARLADQDSTKVAWGGTPGYAAPEQILDPKSSDARSDLYAVGALLYSLLSGGTTPYDELIYPGIGNEPRVMLKAYFELQEGKGQLKELAELNAAVPAAVMEFLREALQPKASKRFQNVKEMMASLVSLMPDELRPTSLGSVSVAEKASEQGSPDSEITESPRPAMTSGRPAYGRVWWLVVAGVVLLSGGLLYLQNQGAESVKSPIALTATATASATTEPQFIPHPFLLPTDVAVGLQGEVYVADQRNHRVQLIKDGRVSTFAGGSGLGFEDGPLMKARFDRPIGLVMGADGALYVADAGNHRVRVIRDGEVKTFAGGFEAGDADGPALKTARFGQIMALAIDGDGAVYLVDAANHSVRRIRDGRVHTIAGGEERGDRNGPVSVARFDSPVGIAVDSKGVIYVRELVGRIRVIREGTVSLLTEFDVGRDTVRMRHKDALLRRYFTPRGLAVTAAGELLVARVSKHRIYKVGEDKKLELVAGSGAVGSNDGYAQRAKFYRPSGMAVGSDGAIFVADVQDNAVRVIQGDKVRTVARAPRGGYAEGKASEAQFRRPWGLGLDADGTLSVGDWLNHRVRAVAKEKVSLIAGTGEVGAFDGAAGNAQFSSPWDLATTVEGDIYVADGHNHRIRVIRGDEVSTLAGTGKPGRKDGPISEATFHFPEGVAVDTKSGVYVADSGNNLIRVVENGKVRTLAGTGEAGLKNGSAEEATFHLPGALAVGADGSVYVADTGNHVVRRIHEGRVITLAGTGEPGFADGQQAEAQFESPIGIAVTTGPRIVVADTGNHRIRIIENGIVKTIAGRGQPGYADARGILAAFAAPADVEFGEGGRLFVADSANNVIRVIEADGMVGLLAGTRPTAPSLRK